MEQEEEEKDFLQSIQRYILLANHYYTDKSIAAKRKKVPQRGISVFFSSY